MIENSSWNRRTKYTSSGKLQQFIVLFMRFIALTRLKLFHFKGKFPFKGEDSRSPLSLLQRSWALNWRPPQLHPPVAGFINFISSSEYWRLQFEDFNLKCIYSIPRFMILNILLVQWLNICCVRVECEPINNINVEGFTWTAKRTYVVLRLLGRFIVQPSYGLNKNHIPLYRCFGYFSLARAKYSVCGRIQC